ncbi:ABC transporter permease [Caldisericum exile]|uniref:ABC transporter permease protein n=1 Tax=Caldisericum exile (strain DSM 21853 / NBRC 104410 / AZM16c01) TaxID=511051 RepID=A0A7U6GFN4_CALEA|nr:ABC transporter permease subunit [Caldisericum exile]BAL81494.1 putative ABC transporter permease protein [Caldisericum exile AZM16c01]
MKKIRKEYLLILPFFVFLGFFELYPIINLFIKSFFSDKGTLTLQFYRNILTIDQYKFAVRNSLLFSTAASVFGGVVGTFVGYFISKLNRSRKNFLLSLYSLPLTLSGLVVAFAFIILLGRNGVINQIIRLILHLPKDFYINIYSWPGIVFVYGFFQIPLMTLTMAAVFENLDKSIVEAAKNLGANAMQTWRYVIIPSLAPGFISGLSIQFAGMLGAFGTVLALVGGEKNLLSIQIYFQTSESTYNLPQAAALSVTLILIISIVLSILNIFEKKLKPGG